MTVGFCFFFFPATNFSPLCLQRCHHFHREMHRFCPKYYKIFHHQKGFPGIWVTRICHFLLSQGAEHQVQIPALTGATWARTEVTVTKKRPSRWRSVLPTGVPPQLLSTPPNHQKNPMFTSKFRPSKQLCSQNVWPCLG